jgi:hypothetical protein
MKITLRYIVALVFSGGLFSGCLPDPADEALVYKGPTVVEFKNHTLGMIASSVDAPNGLDARGILSTTGSVQTDSSRVISLVGYKPTAARTVSPRTVDTVYVQLVGPQRSSDTQVQFETFDASIRNAAGAITTANAVEGADYTLEPAGTRSVVIPANSSVGYLLIRPIVSNFTGTQRKRVGIRLLGATDAAPNPRYDTFYVTMTRTL